jgi:peptidoglycan/LPS O-acetylase OafA/YrhL
MHLSALTGMRIFAALAVYFSHLRPPAGAPTRLLTFLASGYAGVTFFFVLSGFVLAVNYFDRLSTASARGIWSFAVARLARVYPLYVLIVVYLIVQAKVQHVSVNGWVSHLLAVQAWQENLAQVYSLNPPGWSIGVEFFLYATFPVLVLLLARAERGLWSLVLLTTGVIAAMVLLVIIFKVTGRDSLPWQNPGSAHRWLYRMPATRIGDFLLGILMARIYLQLRHRKSALTLGSVLIAVSIIASVLLAISQRNLFSAASWDLSWAVPAALLVLGLAIAPRNPVALLLATPLIVFLGEASYAFYLCHWTVLGWTGAGAWADSFTIWTVTLVAFNLAIVMLVAAALHIFIERPARGLIRSRLDRRRRAPVPVAPRS